jgi:hypothetical protein
MDGGELDAEAGASTADASAADASPAAEAGACAPVIDAVTELPAIHVAQGTPIVYASNPPSSGAHYGSWANFQEYADPVPDGNLVHSLEHGAVLLLYKCSSPAECQPILEALRSVRAAAPADPLCSPAIRVRIILAPRPALDVPVAAAAWGFTYKAECVDAPSLAQFITDHYAKTAENFCAAGVTTF